MPRSLARALPLAALLSALLVGAAAACGPCWMWETPVPTTWAGKLDAMIKHGYLERAPRDPGYGPESFQHYRITKDGYGITCKVHGSIPGKWNGRWDPPEPRGESWMQARERPLRDLKPPVPTRIAAPSTGAMLEAQARLPAYLLHRKRHPGTWAMVALLGVLSVFVLGGLWKRRRRGLRELASWVLVCATVVVLLEATIFLPFTHRMLQEECYRQQKTLAGALEMCHMG